MPTNYAQVFLTAAVTAVISGSASIDGSAVVARGEVVEIHGGIVNGDRPSRGQQSLQVLELTNEQALQIDNALASGQGRLNVSAVALPSRVS